MAKTLTIFPTTLYCISASSGAGYVAKVTEPAVSVSNCEAQMYGTALCCSVTSMSYLKPPFVLGNANNSTD